MQDDSGGTVPAPLCVSALKPQSLKRHTYQDDIDQPRN